DRGAEYVKCRHRDLEAVAGLTDQVSCSDMAVCEGDARKRGRRDHLDTFDNRQAGIVAAHDERRQALRAGGLACTSEYNVKIGDAPVRNPGLLTIKCEAVAVSPRRR